MRDLVNYRMAAGQYVLCEGETPVAGPVDEIAVALDAVTGTVHKVGSVEVVNAWAKTTREAYGTIGRHDMAADTQVVSGRLPIEEVHALMGNVSYGKEFLRKLQAGELQEEPRK